MAKTEKKIKEEGEQKDIFNEKLKSLNSKYGSGTIIRGNDISEIKEVVSTGSFCLDVANNLGGNPVGKLIEVFGQESSGKSTLTLHAIANFQTLDGEVVLIDYENSFDKTYAIALGVQVDKLIVINPECAEDGYNIAEELIKTGKVRLVVIDSHTAGVPRMVLDALVGETKISPDARVNSTALKKIKPLLMSNRCTLIAIAQLRTAIGDYGTPDKPTGGAAYRFYSDMRYKVSKSIDKERGLNKTVVEVVKSKCAPPFGKAEFCIVWGRGVDRQQEIIDLAVEYKLIDKSGGWYKKEGVTIANGDDKMKVFMNDNIEWATQLEISVLDKLKGTI